MTEENPNVGKQFEEIMGHNFTPEEQKDIVAKTTAEHLFSKMEDTFGSYRGAVEHGANQRMALFPEKMMSIDEDGRHVSYTSPKGWTHKWWGGSYIEHYHPKHGPVEVTNVEKKDGELPIMSPEEFLQHSHDAEDEFEANYDPKDWK